MNLLDNQLLDAKSFAFKDIIGQDKWESFTVSPSITAVGTPTYVGRYHVAGKVCHFQITAVSTTSVATTAGTSYFALPIAAKGIAGVATMSNDTTNVAVGVGHIDVANSRVYPPSQVASGNTFTVAGWYEV